MKTTSRAASGHSSNTDEFPDLARFFAPHSVALLGATDDLTKFGGRCMRQMINFGFTGEIYPINPKRDDVFGRPCFPSIAALPQTPDHIGIVLPAHAVPAALEQCAARGVPFATVFSSGFGETGSAEGRRLQQRIVEIAHASGIHLMGPNCNGVINFVDAFALTSTSTINGPRRPAGDIGIVSQSGGAGQINVMWRAHQAGLGISYEVSCGNAADINLLDYAAYMVASTSTKVVLILAEQLTDGGKLRALARRAAELDKPLIMIKAGRTEAGSRAAAAHTGAVTGNDAVCDAALSQLGILRVDDYRDLYETAMLLRSGRRPAGRRVAATSISGGNLVMLADLAAVAGIEWPQYSADTQARLRELLPGFGVAANPSDLTSGAIGQPGTFAAANAAVLEDPAVDLLIPVITNVSSTDVRALAKLSAKSAKPVAMLWIGRSDADPDLTPERLVAAGHAIYHDAMSCVKAVRAAMRYGEFRQRLTVPAAPRPDGIDTAAARALLAQTPGTLSEDRCLALLSCYGLPMTRDTLTPDAEMIADAPQMRVAIVRDATFGPVIKISAGGIYAEILKDVAFRLPPFSPEEALGAVRALRAFGLLEETHGHPAGDLAALAEFIARISWLAVDLQDLISELAVNSLRVLPQGRGVHIADARAVAHSGHPA